MQTLRYFRQSWSHLRNHRAFREAPVLTLVRAVWWLLHCVARVPANISTPFVHGRMFLPPRLRHAGSSGIFILRERYEPELEYWARKIERGMVVVDGGASLGIYTLIASRLVGTAGTVLAFEPGEYSFSILSRNLKLNGSVNVSPHRAALSDRTERTRLYHTGDSPNRYSLSQPDEALVTSEPVQAIRLDDVLESKALGRLDLLKLDVEGAEESALRGAARALRAYRPIVIFELSALTSMHRGVSRHGAWQLLEDLHYDFYALDSRGFLTPLEIPKAGNIIALPQLP
jgi:FkbM family methyltransferase